MLLANIFCIASSLVYHQATAISHPHNTTTSESPNSKVKIKDDLQDQPFNEQGISRTSANMTTELVEIKQEKELGIWDEVPESGNFKINDEVESYFLNQVNARINEFEDLKSEIEILERHLRKHSDFEAFNNTDHMLVDLDEKAIKPYEDGLKVLKNKIINSNHEMNATSVFMVNTIVDNAEKFLEINRERVDEALDDHLASEEHKHEHEHGHSEDHLADYLDLISDETQFIIEEEETELLIEYIDMDIDEFKHIEKQKIDLEKHIKDHFNLDHIEPDELQLKVAENVLQNLNLQDMKSYEDSLQALKIRIKDSNGKLNIEEIDQMAATLGQAEKYLDSSKDKLKLVGDLDQEFEVYEKVENNIRPPKTNEDDGHLLTDISTEANSEDLTNPVKQYSHKVEEAFNKAAEDSQQYLHENKHGRHVYPEEDVVEVEEFPTEFLPFHFSATLTSLLLVVLMVVALAAVCRLFSKNGTKKLLKNV